MNKTLEATERRKRRDPEIRVWDRFVRIQHWLLVLCFATAYLEYKKFPLHTYAGYLICILVTLRIIWGFLGTGAAKFSAFLFSPKEILDYLKNAFSGKATYHFSHNPAGAAMVYALLGTLWLNCFLGLMAYSASQQLGPFSALIPNSWEELLISVHTLGGHLIAFLVIGHIIGVIWAARLHRENYVLAMLTGLRRIPRAVQLPPGTEHPTKPKSDIAVLQKTIDWLSFKHPFVGTLLLTLLIVGAVVLPIVDFFVGFNKLLPSY